MSGAYLNSSGATVCLGGERMNVRNHYLDANPRIIGYLDGSGELRGFRGGEIWLGGEMRLVGEIRTADPCIDAGHEWAVAGEGFPEGGPEIAVDADGTLRVIFPESKEEEETEEAEEDKDKDETEEDKDKEKGEAEEDKDKEETENEEEEEEEEESPDVRVRLIAAHNDVFHEMRVYIAERLVISLGATRCLNEPTSLHSDDMRTWLAGAIDSEHVYSHRVQGFGGNAIRAKDRFVRIRASRNISQFSLKWLLETSMDGAKWEAALGGDVAALAPGGWSAHVTLPVVWSSWGPAVKVVYGNGRCVALAGPRESSGHKGWQVCAHVTGNFRDWTETAIPRMGGESITLEEYVERAVSSGAISPEHAASWLENMRPWWPGTSGHSVWSGAQCGLAFGNGRFVLLCCHERFDYSEMGEGGPLFGVSAATSKDGVEWTPWRTVWGPDETFTLRTYENISPNAELRGRDLCPLGAESLTFANGHFVYIERDDTFANITGGLENYIFVHTSRDGVEWEKRHLTWENFGSEHGPGMTYDRRATLPVTLAFGAGVYVMASLKPRGFSASAHAGASAYFCVSRDLETWERAEFPESDAWAAGYLLRNGAASLAFANGRFVATWPAEDALPETEHRPARDALPALVGFSPDGYIWTFYELPVTEPMSVAAGRWEK